MGDKIDTGELTAALQNIQTEIAQCCESLRTALKETKGSSIGPNPNTLRKLDTQYTKLGKQFEAYISKQKDLDDRTGKATKGLKEFGAATETTSKEVEKTAGVFKRVYDAGKEISGNLLKAGQAVRANREDFTSLSGAVDAYAGAAQLAAKGIGGAIRGITGVLSLVTIKFPVASMAIAGIGNMIAGVTETIAKESIEFAKGFAKFSLEEVQRVNNAFRSIADVGGLSGSSLKGVYETSQKLGIGMDGLAKILSRSSQSLALTVGTVGKGAEVMSKITTAGTNFEKEFLKLGFSFEQQAEFGAKFLASQRYITKVNLNDIQGLSKANREYMLQVDELARLTGKSKNQVATEIEAMTRELRFGATLAIATEKGTDKAILNTAMMLETHGSKAIGEGFKDIFGGATTERAQQLMMVTGNRAAGIAERLMEGQIDASQAMEEFKSAMTATYNILGRAKFEQLVGKLGVPMEALLPGVRAMAMAQDISLEKAKEMQEKDKKAAGKEIDSMVDANVALRNLAVSLDKLVMEKLFPTMADTVKMLTNSLHKGATEFEKILKQLGSGKDKPAPLTDADRKAWILETGGVLPFKDGRQLNTEEAAADWVQRGRPKWDPADRFRRGDGGFWWTRARSPRAPEHADAAAGATKLGETKPDQSKHADAAAGATKLGETKPDQSKSGGRHAQLSGIRKLLKEKTLQPASGGSGPIAAAEPAIKFGTPSVGAASAPPDQRRGKDEPNTGGGDGGQVLAGEPWRVRGQGQPRKQTTGVIYHHTGGRSLSGALATLQKERLGYHYIIGRRGEITPYVPDDLIAYHGGDNERNRSVGNFNTIGVSALANKDDDVTPEQVQVAVALHRQLAGKFGFSSGSAYGHGETSTNKMRTEGLTIADAIRKGQIPSAAQGGLLSGPESGYNVIAHGREAMVPLPDGRNIPVDMPAMTDRMNEQISLMSQQLLRFDNMIDLLQASADTQTKIYQATAT